MQGAIDDLLRHLLRSICTLLAGENATGTLWLCDGNHGFHRVHLALREGLISTRVEAGYGSESGVPLTSSELPRSGAPNCCSGHGMNHWTSCGLRGFVSLPMSIDGKLLGCFVVHLKPADSDPLPAHVELAESMARLATHAMEIDRRAARASW